MKYVNVFGTTGNESEWLKVMRRQNVREAEKLVPRVSSIKQVLHHSCFKRTIKTSKTVPKPRPRAIKKTTIKRLL